jgi:prepilin-type N-terminal cleavage/methylation domain-containing protein
MHYFFKNSVQNNCKFKKGFTLVEAMVSIAILSIALLGPFYAAQQSLTASNTAKDQLTASMLGQEAIEYVRSIRDGDYLYISSNPATTRTWMYGLDGNGGTANCFTPNKCTVDPEQQLITACSSGNCSPYPLYINASTDLYNQSNSGMPTTFVRSVQLMTISATEVKVVATVSWYYHNAPFSTSITEYLDNWQ